MANAVLTRMRELLTGAGLPELGPGPRAGVRSAEDLRGAVEECLEEGNCPASWRPPLLALVLLWHDHLEESHRISQGIPSADGSYVHGIMHRREPDYSNAKYWFRRVGTHPAFGALSERAGEILGAEEAAGLRKRLLRGGEWDAFAFVDACAEAARGSASEQELLCRVQAAEFEVLLEFFCEQAT